MCSALGEQKKKKMLTMDYRSFGLAKFIWIVLCLVRFPFFTNRHQRQIQVTNPEQNFKTSEIED